MRPANRPGERRTLIVAALVTALALLACQDERAARSRAPDRGVVLAGPHAAAIVDSVRAFAQSVARGVSRDGPGAWRAYFVASPAFFMAAEGRLVFPSSDAATRGIAALERQIRTIELRWTDTVRVDPLAAGFAVVAVPYYERRADTTGRAVEEVGFFTGIAEHQAGGWRFRDAHWSVAGPPPRVP